MYNPKNILSGQLNKPSVVSLEDAARICDELGLAMPPECLLEYLRCRTSRKAIPYDEIYLVDSLYAIEGVPEIKSFKTENAFLGESYADLIKKHAAAYGDLARVTLDSLVDTPDIFSEKYSPSFSTAAQSTSSSALARYCEGRADSLKLPFFTVDEDSSFGLYQKLPRENLALLDRSYLIALLPGGNMTREEYEDEAIKTISLLENSMACYNPFVIGNCGVLGEVIRLGAGAIINTDAYPENPACRVFASTLSAFSGYGAFLVTERNKKQISSAMLDSRLKAIECARLISDDVISVCTGKKLVCEIDLDQMSRVNVHKKLSVAANTVASTESTARLSSLCGCDSIVQKQQTGAYKTATDVFSHARCEINESTVANGIFTALLPIFELAACGVERKNITVSKKIEIDTAHDPSNAVSTVISLLRAQIELSVHGESNSVRYDADQNSIDVFARGVRTLSHSPADSFVRGGDGIYILSPMKKGQDIPDFETVRKLVDYLYAIIRKGLVISAKAFYNTPLDKAVASMETARIKSNTRALEGIVCPALYIIIEASDSIGGTHIGETSEENGTDAPYTGTAFFGSAYEKTPNPNVLVLDFGSKEARLKTAIRSLSRRGARVKYIKATLETKCLEYIASVLPQTHIVLFCGNDDQIADAMCDVKLHAEIMRYRESRRLIIAYGSGAVSALSDLQYLPAVYSSSETLNTSAKLIELYSKNTPSAFSAKRISYKAKLIGDCELIRGDHDGALICANIDGEIFSDGLVSSDGLNIGVYSLLCDEIIESAIKYYI